MWTAWPASPAALACIRMLMGVQPKAFSTAQEQLLGALAPLTWHERVSVLFGRDEDHPALLSWAASEIVDTLPAEALTHPVVVRGALRLAFDATLTHPGLDVTAHAEDIVTVVGEWLTDHQWITPEAVERIIRAFVALKASGTITPAPARTAGVTALCHALTRGSFGLPTSSLLRIVARMPGLTVAERGQILESFRRWLIPPQPPVQHDTPAPAAYVEGLEVLIAPLLASRGGRRTIAAALASMPALESATVWRTRSLRTARSFYSHLRRSREARTMVPHAATTALEFRALWTRLVATDPVHAAHVALEDVALLPFLQASDLASLLEDTRDDVRHTALRALGALADQRATAEPEHPGPSSVDQVAPANGRARLRPR